MSFVSLFRKIFPKKVNIYTAIGPSDYSRVIGRLIDHSVPYYTKMNFDTRERHYHQDLSKTYDIYVREEDEYRAVEAINKR